MPPITGQSVLIIGGSTGLGFAVASLCLTERMNVHIASSNSTKIAAAADRLRQTHPDANLTTHVCQLGGSDNQATLRATLDASTASGEKKLDHIILTAGDANVFPLSSVTQPILESAASLRIFSAILLAKLAPTYLVPHWTSSLTFTGGAVATKPHKGYTYPSFFAGGLHQFARAVAVELAPVRVNVVAPGPTETELWGPEGGEMRRMIKAQVEGSAMLGKAGRAEEVAEAYGYLMRDSNATGMNYDWNFATVPQPELLDRVVNQNRCKVLGGSSALNLMTLDRGAVADYDAWEALDNPGWNWKAFLAAMSRMENFVKTDDRYGNAGVGAGGPIQTLITRVVTDQQCGFVPALNSLGIPENRASLNGDPLGVMYQPSNIGTRTTCVPTRHSTSGWRAPTCTSGTRVIPVQPSAHLQTVVHGIAEMVAERIVREYVKTV